MVKAVVVVAGDAKGNIFFEQVSSKFSIDFHCNLQMSFIFHSFVKFLLLATFFPC